MAIDGLTIATDDTGQVKGPLHSSFDLEGIDPQFHEPAKGRTAGTDPWN